MQLDDEGYLVDPADWNEQVAEALARQERIVLSEEHKRQASQGRNDLFVLFPYGYVKQACKIAGMRRPRAWSTG